MKLTISPLEELQRVVDETGEMPDIDVLVEQFEVAIDGVKLERVDVHSRSRRGTVTRASLHLADGRVAEFEIFPDEDALK